MIEPMNRNPLNLTETTTTAYGGREVGA